MGIKGEEYDSPSWDGEVDVNFLRLKISGVGVCLK